MISFHLYSHRKFIRIHHPLCQSTLDPWMTPRCGFCPKNIRSFFPSWCQHYSDHFATSIVSQKEHMLLEKNKLNNRVSQVMTRFSLGFSPDVGSLRTFQISSLSTAVIYRLLPGIPCLSVSSNHLFQPKKTIQKNGTLPGPKHLWSLVFAYKMFENKTPPYPETQRPLATLQVKVLYSSRVSVRCRLNKVADASAWWNDETDGFKMVVKVG